MSNNFVVYLFFIFLIAGILSVIHPLIIAVIAIAIVVGLLKNSKGGS